MSKPALYEDATGAWGLVEADSLAVLAKSLVPLALAAPLILYYRRWRDLLRARVILPLLAIALPWYVLCYMRNGRPFLTELFWKHQFQRVVSTTLMHVQPWWFYVPVFVGLLLPWSPLLPALARFRASADPRRRFLLSLVIWGFIFFSIPINNSFNEITVGSVACLRLKVNS